MNFRTLAIGAIASMLAPLAQADAAVVTDHFSVFLEPTAFTINSGTGLTAPVSISFDLTFDPTVVYPDTYTELSNLTYSGFTVDSTIGFMTTASTDTVLPNALVLGGQSDGVGQVFLSGSNDFYLHIINVASATPTFQQFGIVTSSGDYYYTPTDGTLAGATLTIAPATVSSVPLPSSLPMFGAGLLGVASVGFARRRRNAAATARANA